MAIKFVPVDRDTAFLFPPSVQEWLPEGHLARFIVDVVNQLDLSGLESAYAGRGSAPYHPSMLLGLLIYGYATGVYSSRAIERATHDSVAFRFVAANTHPDHDTINTFRKLFWNDIESAFRQVLRIAAGMKLVKRGGVSLDGTRIKANASKHSALSYGHAKKLEAQIEAEISELKRRAETAEGLPDEQSLPAELQRREDRLAAIRQAQSDIEARAAERDALAQAEYQDKLKAREAQRQQGKKPKGRPPQPPQTGPSDSDQINLTDPESRILPAGSDFVQGYNAQAVVDAESMLVLACNCVQAANDKQQVEPMLDPLRTLPQRIGLDAGPPMQLAAVTGYFSQANAEACEAAGIIPLIAIKRESHSGWLDRRLAAAPTMPETPTALSAMRYRLATPAGRAAYGQRKCSVEPCFGIIKQVMRFRQFLLRGLHNAKHEWALVCLAFNLKRMAALNG